jgi:O-antigen/teichoic acid export membrane protein
MLGGLFHVHGSGASDFTIALIVMSVLMGLTFPAGLYTGINQGFGHYRQQNTILIAQNLGAAVFGVLAVILGGGLIMLTVVWSAFTVLGFLAKAIYARRAYSVTPSPSHYDRATARELVGTSVWMFLINIAGKMIWDSDTIVIGNILGTANVAHYAVALGPATAVRRITDQFTSVSLTAASGLKARSEHDGLRRLLTEATRVVAIVISPFVVLFALWGHQFLTVWVGPDLSSSADTLVILVVGMLATSIQAAAGQVLVALGRQRAIAGIAIGEALANLALSIFLATRMGIAGVALGTAIPTTITALGIYVPYAAHLLDVPLSRIAGRLVIPASVCLVAYLAFRFPLHMLHFSSLPVFMAFAACFVGVLVASSILLDSEERHTYLGLFGVWRRNVEGTT